MHGDHGSGRRGESAQHWRECAEEVRAIAAMFRDADAKHIMLQIAGGYELLAKRAQARQARTKNAA